MELSEQNLQSLLSDDDIQIDDDLVETEDQDDDLLGLDALKNKEPEDNQDNDDDEDDDNNGGDDQPSSNFISDYLKSFGIEDMTKIKMQDEEGNVKEVDFNSLSEEEKLNIFKELSDPGYTDYEKSVINYLRQNNVTLDAVIDYYKQQAIDEYLNEHPEDAHKRTYNIDDYTDDEVYLADLKNKYSDFSDEELMSKLESAKLNEELFTKEVAAIRANQKAMEEEQIRQQEELEANSYQELQENLQRAMADFTQIELDPEDKAEDSLSLEVTDADRELMLRYLIERDKDGKSQLVRDLEDPNALIELAYYRTRERDNITGLTRYWKNQLAEERKEKAKIQKELDRIKNKGKNSFVVPPKEDNGSKKNRTIMDIYG